MIWPRWRIRDAWWRKQAQPDEKLSLADAGRALYEACPHLRPIIQRFTPDTFDSVQQGCEVYVMQALGSYYPYMGQVFGRYGDGLPLERVRTSVALDQVQGRAVKLTAQDLCIKKDAMPWVINYWYCAKPH